ncbi:MAG: electron transfer flavoprotein subunit beta/FixA family protein [Thermogutta sp.]
MNVVSVVRLVPDLVESLVVTPEEDNLVWDETSFIFNESDDHALEEAILLKEKFQAHVTVVAFDYVEIDQVLYMAAAKGVDRIIKISWPHREPPNSLEVVETLREVVSNLNVDLILMGCQSHTEFLGMAAPQLAAALGWPYVGVVRGVQKADDLNLWKAFKEYPQAVLAEVEFSLPAVLGILTASQPPRYVPVSRIRSAAQNVKFEMAEGPKDLMEPPLPIRRVYLTPTTARAEMLQGSETDVARRLVDILITRGVLK